MHGLRVLPRVGVAVAFAASSAMPAMAFFLRRAGGADGQRAAVLEIGDMPDGEVLDDGEFACAGIAFPVCEGMEPAEGPEARLHEEIVDGVGGGPVSQDERVDEPQDDVPEVGFDAEVVIPEPAGLLVAADLVCADFRKDTREMKRTSILGMHYRSLFASVVSFASSLALAVVLWRGGLLSREGVMEIGTLSLFMSYAISMMEPFFWISSAVSELIAAQVNIERFSRLVNTPSDVADTPEVMEQYGDAFHPKRENWEPLHGDVEFRDVSFRYPDGDETIFEHFNLKVPQGANVALVGETGAGKSTLVNLVCRFFEPTAGQILIDGRDVRERSQLWLHSHIGYVLQTPYLFSGTVRENLLYGNPDATEEQIALAVKRVSADRVIARMGNGLDSQVGECGDLLSTGEKQLISFARAILADPRILVLDEATSSVDTVTEKMIQDAIGEVTRGRTSFVIAHRLSTIRNADLILVMKDGRVVEQGTHCELMRARGYYHSLYTKQFELEAVKDLS